MREARRLGTAEMQDTRRKKCLVWILSECRSQEKCWGPQRVRLTD